MHFLSTTTTLQSSMVARATGGRRKNVRPPEIDALLIAIFLLCLLSSTTSHLDFYIFYYHFFFIFLVAWPFARKSVLRCGHPSTPDDVEVDHDDDHLQQLLHFSFSSFFLLLLQFKVNQSPWTVKWPSPLPATTTQFKSTAIEYSLAGKEKERTDG